jgi:RHH-type proline utilization regulon transcriptional repressor/proline dehydrogenase/delta 1-pyrroline-5-carboxylate dehydrogenase
MNAATPQHLRKLLPQGARFSPEGPLAERSALREAIARATRLSEPEALAPLMAQARPKADQAALH